MKPLKSTVVLVLTAFALIASTATASTALAGIGYSGSVTGSFYTLPGSYAQGDSISLVANFPSTAANKTVTFYGETTSGSYDEIASDPANGSGNAYASFTATADRKVFGKLPNGDVTNLGSLDPTVPGECTQTGTFYTSPAVVGINQKITLTGNFPSDQGNKTVTFFKKSGATETSVGADVANSSGNAYLVNYDVGTQPQNLFAKVTSTNQCTETDTITPMPVSATLGDFSTAGSYGQAAEVTATFSPAKPGTTATLQYERFGKPGEWANVTTAKQSSSGQAKFYISNPLEVEHKYRATSNGVITTNTKTFKGQLLNKPTGLGTVHFSSVDGASVNTRSKYFKGEFVIKPGAGCSAITIPAGDAEMKGRGNYSWSFPKKGFNVKFDDKADLCGMGKSKKWALVANDYDRSLLRNTVANEVGDIFDNLDYTPNDTAVDLYVNGSFRGSYILIERINFEGGRLDFPELKEGDLDTPGNLSGSYLMEWDFRHDAFSNFYAGDSEWVGLKEPEDEDWTRARFDFINSYADQADDALFGDNFTSDSNGWKKYIDEKTAVDYYLAMEYMKPVDGNMWASVYMYKPRYEPGKPGSGKIRMGPLWDFDLAAGSANRAGNVVSPNGWYLRNPLNVSARQTAKSWFNRLIEDPDFRDAVKDRWNVVDGQLYGMDSYVDQKAAAIRKSADWNYRKWNHDSKISQYQVVKGSWSEDASYLSRWVQARASWMNSQLDNND